jgi:hypothetical protein
MNYPHPMDDKTGFEATDEEMGLGRREAQCDCCARYVPRDEISRCWAFGIETFACDECRSGS